MQAILFPVGILSTLVGVYELSKRTSEEPKSQRKKSALSRCAPVSQQQDEALDSDTDGDGSDEDANMTRSLLAPEKRS